MKDPVLYTIKAIFKAQPLKLNYLYIWDKQAFIYSFWIICDFVEISHFAFIHL